MIDDLDDEKSKRSSDLISDDLLASLINQTPLENADKTQPSRAADILDRIRGRSNLPQKPQKPQKPQSQVYDLDRQLVIEKLAWRSLTQLIYTQHEDLTQWERDTFVHSLIEAAKNYQNGRESHFRMLDYFDAWDSEDSDEE